MLRALGQSKKIGFKGSTQAALKALVPMKRLRGTALDPFGRAHVRKVERELLRHYRVTLHALVSGLSAENYDRAVSFAVLPDMVRGYEDIKLRNAERYAAAIVALGLPAPDGLAS
jgi:indolepyruvate ferredoxin oxidoreductase